jgi:hypothetical protein
VFLVSGSSQSPGVIEWSHSSTPGLWSDDPDPSWGNQYLTRPSRETLDQFLTMRHRANNSSKQSFVYGRCPSLQIIHIGTFQKYSRNLDLCLTRFAYMQKQHTKSPDPKPSSNPDLPVASKLQDPPLIPVESPDNTYRNISKIFTQPRLPAEMAE